MTGRGIPPLITSACCILIFLGAAAAEPGDDVNPPVQQQVSLTSAAALLIQSNRIDDAERVLALALQQNPEDLEAIFLRGLIAVARQNFDAAVEDFRRILAVEPARERVRLELARAFFLQGDYENAERNFRFARAGDLPESARANVDQYVAAITRLKRWSYNFSLGLADDTNVNGATNLHTVYLYGLPFTLSDDARQTSGIGAAIDISGEFSPLLSGSSKFLAGGLIHRLQFGQTRFDDMTVSLYAGPQFFWGRWRFDTLATGFGRWYGEAPYSGGAGGRASAGYALLSDFTDRAEPRRTKCLVPPGSGSGRPNLFRQWRARLYAHRVANPAAVRWCRHAGGEAQRLCRYDCLGGFGLLPGPSVWLFRQSGAGLVEHGLPCATRCVRRDAN